MRRARSFPFILLLLAVLAGCVHNVDPRITTAKVAAVTPPIGARVILLVPASFEAFTPQSSQGIHTYKYHFGAAATTALSTLVAASFRQAETRHLPDSDVLQYLSAPADTGLADIILVAAMQGGGMSQRLLDISAEADVRLDARELHTGRTFSWVGAGHTTRALSSLRGLTGSALEQSLRALSDSLAAHRSELEVSVGQ